jgi:putative transposase
MSPKDEWLRSFGIADPWPAFGKPSVIATDNAKEFRSHDLECICLEHDIVYEARPVGHPEYGGRI